MIRTLAFAFAIFGLSLFGLTLFGASATESTPMKPAELEVLSRYVGDWDLAFDADDPFSQGTLTGKWVLDGAYLEQTGEMTARFVPKDLKIRTLTTYDADTRQYKRWAFLSNGRSLAYTGTWDPKTSTMVWASENFDPQSQETIKTKTIEEFRDDDTVDVSKVSVRAGREVGRSIEYRTRRK